MLPYIRTSASHKPYQHQQQPQNNGVCNHSTHSVGSNCGRPKRTARAASRAQMMRNQMVTFMPPVAAVCEESLGD